ncbi:DUF1269 domain-containing protein [Acinetobacter shaoyimingii]|uniref:DUF1269 domain-containing protein n=1 Tax=Acinetobacter shaoyimingii TaxID=2715164 RepID=A0A6G8RUJ0_9GAMM|nr:DUF1269 domain-containing protein [Acinetobacter shaoyimingii]QIO05584.1 DUF1269 domain-containing protein [Acinetobacter shaoyimingii]
MAHHILLVTWRESSKAYESFIQLKNQQNININQVIVVKRADDGSIQIQDNQGNDVDSNTLFGGLFGSLIGILGGPLGVLLGFSTGALVGSLNDADEFDENSAVLSKISQLLPLGETALFVDLEEEDESIADEYLATTHATVYRWDYDEVEAEIEASVETWDEVKRLTNVALKQQKKDENKVNRKKKWQEFTSKFHNQ